MARQLETTSEIIVSAAQKWAADNPRTVAYLTELEQRGVRSGIFSSTLSEMVRREAGLPSPRYADDVDLLVTKEDFALAAWLLPNARIHTDKPVNTHTSDGLQLSFIADEALGHTGDQEVQFMTPHTHLHHNGEQYYRTEYTDYAAANRVVVETNYGLVPIAHPFDTMAMYGTLQRNNGKHDAQNTEVLHMVCDPVNDPYAQLRGEEMGLDERVWTYIRGMGRVAVAA